MQKTHDVIATIREWIDKETGIKHKTTLPIGAIFVSSKGNQVLKLDALPLARDWSGFAALKPCAPALPPGRRQPKGMPPPPTPEP